MKKTMKNKIEMDTQKIKLKYTSLDEEKCEEKDKKKTESTIISLPFQYHIQSHISVTELINEENEPNTQQNKKIKKKQHINRFTQRKENDNDVVDKQS